ncbi:MAG: N-acetylmuramidase family protein [Pseudomonas sp.]|uniref:N-acetylmuramidase domain-containing protein n=1 Tax=Pseudomonas sp. TaxID=306 RepID=UPI0033933FB2
MNALRHGDRGQAVLNLQKALNAHGARLLADGHFGDLTETALRAYQTGTGLVPDGIAGRKTLGTLAGQDNRHLLGLKDLQAAATRLDLPLATVLAVNAVESQGDGFLDNGKPVILFERHVMHRQLGDARAAELASKYPNLVNRQPGGYAGGSAEHNRLAMARQLDDSAAIESASWGLFQILGMHWQLLGYASPQAFAERIAASEAEQLHAFVLYIEAHPELHKALKARKWAQFAQGYNGPGYARNLYDAKLAEAYERFSTKPKAAA